MVELDETVESISWPAELNANTSMWSVPYTEKSTLPVPSGSRSGISVQSVKTSPSGFSNPIAV